jgi:hypothetical protein
VQKLRKKSEHFVENYLHAQFYDVQLYGSIFVFTSVRETVILILFVTVNLKVQRPGRRGAYVIFTENPRVTYFNIVRLHNHAEYRVNTK